VTGVVHPVGPERPEVYWRRRIIVVLGLIVILAVIGKLIFGGSDAKPQAEVTQKSSAKPTAVSTPKVSPSAHVVPVIDPTVRSVAGTCHDADLRVTVSSAKHVTPVGAGLSLTLKVTNKSKKTCTRDLGSGANEVTITSGPALVWSTDHCNPSTASDVQTLGAGKSWSVNVIWDGKISEAKCQLLGNAQHGAYWVHAHNGKVQAHAMRFVVN
jgi:hypothetical protein